MREKIKIFFFFGNRERGKKNQRVTSKVLRALFLIWLPLLQICRFLFTNEKYFDWILAGKFSKCYRRLPNINVTTLITHFHYRPEQRGTEKPSRFLRVNQFCSDESVGRIGVPDNHSRAKNSYIWLSPVMYYLLTLSQKSEIRDNTIMF